MSGPAETIRSGRFDLQAGPTRVVLASVLGVAALVLGGYAVSRVISVLSNAWVFKDAERFAVAFSVLTPAFLSSVLLFVAAWLVSREKKRTSAQSRHLSNFAIVVALYGPFFWMPSSRWWHMFPVSPGFTAGVFTKPLDSTVLFMLASGLLTALLLVSLGTIRDRVRYGVLLACASAAGISLLTSYAAYALVRA